MCTISRSAQLKTGKTGFLPVPKSPAQVLVKVVITSDAEIHL
jgi:hypothetical protein